LKKDCVTELGLPAVCFRLWMFQRPLCSAEGCYFLSEYSTDRSFWKPDIPSAYQKTCCCVQEGRLSICC